MNMDWFQQTCEGLVAVNTPEEMRDFLAHRLQLLGHPYFCVGVLITSSFTTPETYLVSNYPPPWWVDYTEQNLILEDGVVQYCNDNDRPRLFTNRGWADLPGHSWADDGGAAFGAYLSDIGLLSGLVVPMHLADKSRGCIVVPHTEPIEVTSALLMSTRVWLQAVVPEAFAALRRVYQVARGQNPPVLTPGASAKSCCGWPTG